MGEFFDKVKSLQKPKHQVYIDNIKEKILSAVKKGATKTFIVGIESAYVNEVAFFFTTEGFTVNMFASEFTQTYMLEISW